ncbi:Gfo/Idh/MocA family oxidoreductase [Persicitalea jodogahamensis]|uniref:Oxidoreductase n=1 Tax=Persicitalea jodogahamensis TaxID=402147 RepID=A0A8J3DA41_9BACT|nr:Gfo/Idh/MocA family oxidoreductase [Persicitalea jodogahamensis]GHB81172.1 oxidoreductase [Persicitalea jodogahamensis]
MKTLNVGLIGFGLSGRYFHAPFLSVNPRFKLKTVVERSKNEAQDFDPAIGNARSVEEMLSDPEIDLVFICTPNDTHFSYAMDALENGKHVVIEKPFANTESEAKQLFEVAERNGLVATAYQNRRWDSDFLTIQKLIRENKLGKIVEYESRYDRFRPEVLANTWKEKQADGSGNVYNLGPHLLDQAFVLFGDPQTVTATISTVREGGDVDDYFDIRLGYDDKFVIVKSSLMVYENSLRYAIHGTKGTFIKRGLDAQEETLRRDVLPNTENWGAEPEDRWGTLYSEEDTGIVCSLNGDYMAFYDSIYDAIVDGKELAVKPAEILRTTRVIDLAFESNERQTTISY